jgi:hypothetical protein
MNTYEITFQTSDYTLHTKGEGVDEGSAIKNAEARLFSEHGLDLSKAYVLEVSN